MILTGIATSQKKTLAVPARLERATFGLGNRCSILLSYGTCEEFRVGTVFGCPFRGHDPYSICAAARVQPPQCRRILAFRSMPTMGWLDRIFGGGFCGDVRLLLRVGAGATKICAAMRRR
jgi:hypothetical protein